MVEADLLDALRSDLVGLQHRVERLEQRLGENDAPPPSPLPLSVVLPSGEGAGGENRGTEGGGGEENEGGEAPASEILRWLFIGWFLTRGWGHGQEGTSPSSP